jgi:hypothetical protein
MKSKPRTLSSPLTFFWKFAATPVIAGLFIATFARHGWKGRDGASDSAEMMAVGLFSLIFIIAWFSWLTVGLKRVVLKEGALYISNYRTEIRVPFSEIREVREGFSVRWFVICIDLKDPTVLGQHIKFRPKFHLYWSRPHPIVRELQSHTQNAGADVP